MQLGEGEKKVSSEKEEGERREETPCLVRGRVDPSQRSADPSLPSSSVFSVWADERREMAMTAEKERAKQSPVDAVQPPVLADLLPCSIALPLMLASPSPPLPFSFSLACARPRTSPTTTSWIGPISFAIETLNLILFWWHSQTALVARLFFSLGKDTRSQARVGA